MKDYKISDLEDLTNIQLEKLIKKLNDKIEKLKEQSNKNILEHKYDDNLSLSNKISHYRTQKNTINIFYDWKINDSFNARFYFSVEDLYRVRLKYLRIKKLERINETE